ncbi:F-box protein SKIP28-like protein [Cinnamomum micranthum f. kanehirae]|uniref:F-box protein SKIP28-like protein n=1 Tax=Cinnamomum micranthum f. kanehirae TaxID=337451 RepID=A0A3S3PR19_9MAGN|nr:F-box protein SKIP28-like protein [Cinnamomum micranthum f. kanehirae]
MLIRAKLDQREESAFLRSMKEDLGHLFWDRLHIPGCSVLTPGGVVRAVEKLNNLKHLRVYGIPNTTKEHLYSLNSLLRINPQRPLVIYNGEHPTCSPYIDVDICPKIDEVRFVFDCPREGRCQKWSCKGFLFCIVRCKECGGSISPVELGAAETVCRDSLCNACWLSLPKCILCNRPSCRQHLGLQSRSSPDSPDFTCKLCISQPSTRYGYRA